MESENEDDIIPASTLSQMLLDIQKQELTDILHRDVQPDECISFHVDMLALAEAAPELAGVIVANPLLGIQRLEEACSLALSELLEDSSDSTELSIKQNVKARLSGLPTPQHSSCFGPDIQGIRSRHVNDLIVVRGTVTHAGPTRVLEHQRQFECTTCGHQFSVQASLEAGFIAQTPSACPGSEIKPCKGKTFRHMKEVQELTDYQEIRIQQKGGSDSRNSAAAYSEVLLEEDLADSCQPGDDVVVTAVIRQRWKPVFPGVKCEVELCLHANNLTVQNSRKFHTEIHGMRMVKLAMMMLLVGGSPPPPAGPEAADQAVASRADIHVLLVGDPGIGKSQFLSCAAKLSPRAVVTNGRGSTVAGLTASAVRSGQDWTLEAGAMVLADGGLCCIDEFNGLKDGAQTVMHEAMEQQTVSVAKAGLLTSLNTRASVLAACNPKGKYDPRITLSANTKLGTALLSRFDIVLVLRDLKVPSWDNDIADHLLGLRSGQPLVFETLDWNDARLKQYIHWAKTFSPVMTAEAEEVLLAYYQNQRQSGMQDASRTTTRMLQSLIRIAQAHARLLARDAVTQQDALVAVLLVDASKVEDGLVELNPMLSLVSDTPDHDFALLSKKLLKRLGLHH